MKRDRTVPVQVEQCVCLLRRTFLLLGERWYMGVLGLFLDVEVDIVLLHIEIDGGSRVTVHR